MRILHVGYAFRPWRSGGLIAYAEDLMEAQAARGDEVTYFFRGRHYPLAPNDRLHRWRRGGVEMRELLNSTLNFGGDTGTLTPEADLAHPPSETTFLEVLAERRPEVIHVQELIGLPTSLLEIARAHGLAVLATLHDYFPLCPVRTLYDVDGQLCHRRDVGAQCVRCSAHAPATRREFAGRTAAYELRRGLGEARGRQAVAAGKRLLGRASHAAAARRDADGAGAQRPARAADPLRYQARRDINVARFSRIDLLIAPSSRVREIYAQLGVDASRVRVLHPTLRHLQDLQAQRFEAVARPIRFVSLNGIASAQKGAEVLVGAVEALHRDGLAGQFSLEVYGDTSEPGRGRLQRIPGVHVGGRYAPAELDRILDGHHVGIVPSVWEEPYGLVGPELLSKGIPVIGNARGGIVDYTQDGATGWVNETADATGLANIMRAIIADPEQVLVRHRWILEHRGELIQPFDRHLAELDSLYGEVMTRAEQRRAELVRVAERAAGISSPGGAARLGG